MSVVLRRADLEINGHGEAPIANLGLRLIFVNLVISYVRHLLRIITSLVNLFEGGIGKEAVRAFCRSRFVVMDVAADPAPPGFTS